MAVLHGIDFHDNFAIERTPMIVCNYFKNDCNEELKDVQHDEYLRLMGNLYRIPRERYIKAAKLIGTSSELYEKVKEKTSFDHRVLQMAHDIMAAYHRYAHDDYGQIPLFLEGGEYRTFLTGRWKKFYIQEIQELTENNDDFVRTVLTAVGFQNSDPGYKAEDRLLLILDQRYYCESWIDNSHSNLISEIYDKHQRAKPLSKDAAEKIIINYMAQNDPEILQITDTLPTGCSFYTCSTDNCWFALCPPNGKVCGGLSSNRLIAISQNTGEVVYDGDAGNEG